MKFAAIAAITGFARCITCNTFLGTTLIANHTGHITVTRVFSSLEGVAATVTFTFVDVFKSATTTIPFVFNNGTSSSSTITIASLSLFTADTVATSRTCSIKTGSSGLLSPADCGRW